MEDEDLLLLLKALEDISESLQFIAQALDRIDERVKVLERAVKALIARRLN